ncbi:unnamed protein product [Caenorhabditis auriculariae]|uniref:Peptidase family M13 n=1 Tax=Caenorhabditis auriculariae TaxID=2777116 RepID=A0A8S1H3A1_9PELO|nr:unnamed protein product [Caenorhabditis auriculariae]
MSAKLIGFTTVLVVAAIGIAIGSLVINILILNKVNTINNNNNNNNIVNNSYHYQPSPQVNSTPGTVQNSDGYKAAAAYLLNGLDDTVDPCIDFYAFTCNKFLASVDLDKLHLQRLGTYDQAQTDVYTGIADTLSKIDVNDKTVSLTERITKAAFDSCSRNLANPPDKTQVIYAEIKNLFGGVPFLQEPLKQGINYMKVSGTIEQKHAVGTLLATFASVDYKNVAQNALYVSQPAVAMARDYYLKSQFVQEVNGRVQEVFEMMQAFAQALNSKTPDDVIMAAAQETVSFEVQVAMASWPDDMLRNYQQQYNPYKINEAAAAYGSLDWKAYIGELFDGLSNPQDQAKYELILTQPSYFAWLNSVFNGNTVNSTVVANYMITQMLFDEADFINPQTKTVAQKANYIHYALRRGRGVTRVGKRDVRMLDLDPISHACMDILTAYMPYGTGFVYVKAQANRTIYQADIQKQTALIIENFQGMIGTLTWMDDFSKQQAKKKSDNLVKNFGWPGKLFGDFKNTAVLDKYHQDYASIVDIYTKDKNNLYDIMSVLKRGLEVRELFRLLLEPADRSNFLQSPAMVNAWYQPERNSITFPYAAWNPPYYNYYFPQAYNFAGQGGTGGHELTHGYDDEGVQFGYNGALTDCSWNKCGWMDYNSSLGFIDMAQCVVTQFSTQCCPEKKGNVHCANGATTQGENIADLGGQQAAYRAYRQYISQLGHEEDRLPGLENYTPNQIFWITYGYSWCMKQSDSNLVRQLLTNPHSPASCRTNQVMQDIPEFGKDFGCCRGTPMYPNPDNRCKVWVGV